VVRYLLNQQRIPPDRERQIRELLVPIPSKTEE
jgi:hypothetical protein